MADKQGQYYYTKEEVDDMGGSSRLDIGKWHLLHFEFSNSSQGWFNKTFTMPSDLSGNNVKAALITQMWGYSGENYGNVLYGRTATQFSIRAYQGTAGSNGGHVIAIVIQ